MTGSTPDEGSGLCQKIAYVKSSKTMRRRTDDSDNPDVAARKTKM